MTRDELNAKLCAQFPELADHESLVMYDGLEDACLGVVQRKCQQPVLCYDRAKCIEILVRDNGMTQEDAEEYFEFNTADLWAGEGTPCFLVRLDAEE